MFNPKDYHIQREAVKAEAFQKVMAGETYGMLSCSCPRCVDLVWFYTFTEPMGGDMRVCMVKCDNPECCFEMAI